MGCGSSSEAPPAAPPAPVEKDVLDLGPPKDFGAVDSGPPIVKINTLTATEMAEFQSEMDKEMDKMLNAEDNHRLKDEDKAEALKLFAEFDKDGSGKLEVKELKQVFEKLGAGLTDSQFTSYCSALLKDYDKDSNHSIDKKEFVRFYSKVLKSEETRSHYAKKLMKKAKEDDLEKAAKAVFTKYDANKDGTIDQQELSKVLAEGLKLDLTPEQWKHYTKDMMDKGDKDGSKKLEFPEFLNMYKKCLASPGIIKKYEEKVIMRYEGGKWKVE